MQPIRHVSLLFLLCVFASSAWAADDREAKVRNDRARVEAEGFWHYNDLAGGKAAAAKSGKPLLVVFRCLPCEACAQLDTQVVDRDPIVRSLMEQFECVRIVHANGLDMAQFNFDYDQSFAAFMMNADGTIYGRYGTRSHQSESDQDVSVESFGKALAGALQLHKNYPAVKDALAAKTGGKQEFALPEESSMLKGKYASKIDYEGQVVKSCIHCHMVGEAKRQAYRDSGETVPDQVLYPWPNPKVIGLTMDPKEMATVASVAKDSPAAAVGMQAGDKITQFDGQPILSTADLQWVLHNAADSDAISLQVVRDAKPVTLTLKLESGWRQKSDISWRASSWGLRRMVTGGMRLEDMSESQRSQAGLDADALGLLVTAVGIYGPNAAAKKAGFQQGDIVVSVAGNAQDMTASAMMGWLLNNKKVGERIPVEVHRGAKTLRLQLPMQP